MAESADSSTASPSAPGASGLSASDASSADAAHTESTEQAAVEAAAARTAVRDGVAVGLATAAYGISFGALSVAAGFDVWQTCVLSLLMFTGGSQFALVGVIAAGGAAAGPSAILSAVLLGARNALYGIRMKPLLAGGFWRRFAAAWLTIDESTAVATAGTTPRSRQLGFWVTGLAVYVGWNATTLVGALLGNAIGDVSAYGLDAAAAAAFLGLLWPRLKKLQPVVVAIGSAAVATVLTPWLPAGLPVLCAAVVGIVAGVTSWPRRRDRKRNNSRATTSPATSEIHHPSATATATAIATDTAEDTADTSTEGER